MSVKITNLGPGQKLAVTDDRRYFYLTNRAPLGYTLGYWAVFRVRPNGDVGSHVSDHATLADAKNSL